MFVRLLRTMGLAALAAGSVASGQQQAAQIQNIRAGVVVLDADVAVGAVYPEEAAPYPWFNLQANPYVRQGLQPNPSVKPASWNIYNPNAPAVLSADLLARWETLDASVTNANLGQKLTKRNAAYWEVFLDNATEASLSSYDILLVNPGSFASLNPGEREKLRQFVDRGGVLWVDSGALQPGTQYSDLANNFPIAFSPMIPGGSGPDVSDQTSPLMQTPNRITAHDVLLLDENFTNCIGVAEPALVGAAGYDPIFGGLAADFAQIQPVIDSNSSPTVGMGRIGDGFVVITSRAVSIKLNRPFGATYLANRGFTAMEPILDVEGMAAAKLAVNIINLLAEYRQEGGGPHKTFSNAVDLSPPLTRRSASPGAAQSTAVVYKNLIAGVINNRVVVYDSDPYADRDGDGNSDDGMPDLIFGASEDEIWQSVPLAPPLSSPVCTEVPDAKTGLPVDELLIVDGNGTLNVFNMRPFSNGILDPSPSDRNPVYTLNPPNGGPVGGSTPVAPTVHEELAYMVDTVSGGSGNVGRIWVVNLPQGSLMKSPSGTNWQIGGMGSQVTMPEFTSAATIGYIPILDNSGGSDKVLYLPFAGGSAGNPSSGFVSLWIGARGERPTDYDPKPGSTASALTVTTRASQQGGLPIFVPSFSTPLGVKLVLLDANGNAMPARGRAGIFGGQGMTDVFTSGAPLDSNGVLTFNFKSGVTSLPPQVTSIRLDYTIDWGSTTGAALLSAIERGRINLPDLQGGGTRRVLGDLSLSPGGTLFMTESAGANDGAVYAFREQGRGLFQLLIRYEMFGRHTISPSGGTPVTYLPVLEDTDGITQMAPPLAGTMGAFTLTGPVSIRNGQAFATATALKNGRLPVTVLMAFPAEPQIPQFHVGDLPDGSSLVQPDLARSVDRTAPETMSILAGPNFNYDPNTGLVRFDSLASIQKGQVQNSLSLSQPVMVRRPGQADQLLDPDTLGGTSWSPLLWYATFNGLNTAIGGASNVPGGVFNPGVNSQVPNAPLATGNSVFVAGQSVVPSILNGAGFANVGVIFAIKANVSPTDPFLISDPVRPWQKQFYQLKFSPSIQGNPSFVWPQLQGTRSMADYRTRLNQATLSSSFTSSSSVAYGISGGDGALVAWGDQGLYTFAKSDFLVADEGRIASFDPSGNLLWSSTAFGSAGNTATANAGTLQSIVRPTRAYNIEGNQVLAVDSGSNRVAILDKAGTESRSISSFILDPNVRPAGLQPNEALTLNGPRDALTYTSFIRTPALTQYVSAGDGEGAGVTEQWVHYLIADTGNHRVIELIDRFYFDPVLRQVGNPITVNGVPQIGVLLWHSPVAASGKGLDYNSVSRVWLPPSAAGTGKYVYVAGVGGTLPTVLDSGIDPSGRTHQSHTGNGGIVIFDPTSPSGMRVFNQLTIPAIAQNVFWNASVSAYQSTAESQKIHLLGNVTAVTARLVPGTSATNPTIAIMVSDGSGVYEATYADPNPGQSLPSGQPEALPVRWLLPNEAYVAIRQNNAGIPQSSNAPLHAMYAKRLDNGDVIVVNGYYGQKLDGTPFSGEILEIDGTPNAGASTIVATNFGFSPLSIQFELPPIQGARGLVLPLFADRK